MFYVLCEKSFLNFISNLRMFVMYFLDYYMFENEGSSPVADAGRIE